MASISPSLADQNIRVLEPKSPPEKKNLTWLSELHRSLLPNTASSRAGLESIAALYSTIALDPNSVVIWASNTQLQELSQTPEGAFASGTVDLRKTQLLLIRSLPFLIKIRLALANFSCPRHVLAQQAWIKKIPNEGAGYILTLGASGNRENRKIYGLPGGHEILLHLEQEFQKRGCLEVWVDTELSNVRAVEFYKRQGYSVVGKKFGQILFKKNIRQ